MLESLKRKKISIGTALAIAGVIAQYEIRLSRAQMATERERAVKEAYLQGYQAHLSLVQGKQWPQIN